MDAASAHGGRKRFEVLGKTVFTADPAGC